EEIQGQAQSSIGETTGDKDMQAEGEKKQSKANVKQAGEKIKDAFKS
ncbi:MAG: CsbD family protein, partial [Acidothermales bacterium]|nr:CsbD family protein [Acidothermales bacterium]